MDEEEHPRDGAPAGADDNAITPPAAFVVALHGSDIGARLRTLLIDMPLSRVINAFACARCASDDRGACLGDLGHYSERAHLTRTRQPPGYSDRSLLGRCIRALVPAEAVAAAVDAAVRSGRAVDRLWARVYNGEGHDARDKESPGQALRLCMPTERDLVRLTALMWTDNVSASHSRASWASACYASAQCWHAITRPSPSPGYAPVLGIRTINGRPCCSHHSFEAAWLAANLERCRKAHACKGVERMQHPHDARISAFTKHRSLGSRGCYTYIEGDPLFIIIADW